MIEINSQSTDPLGPEKVIEVYDPISKMQGIVVIDNLSLGPALGGVRMVPDISVSECRRLARTMTLKCSAAGLALGGGKSMIQGDPQMAKAEKEKLVRSFARSIKDVVDYIPAPDMGTSEHSMAWIKNEINRGVGLPSELGGIPLDEIGATGYGLVIAIEEAAKQIHLSLDSATVAIQGFGAVGVHSANFLWERGAKIIAVSDISGMIQDHRGLNIPELMEHYKQGKLLREVPGVELQNRDAILNVPCDIWIPAARPDVINEKNVSLLDTKIVAEGANIPVTEMAESILHQRGILVLPDFIANAGGIISCYVEHKGGTESSVMDLIRDKIAVNMKQILKESIEQKKMPREVAYHLAIERVKKAMNYRKGFYD